MPEDKIETQQHEIVYTPEQIAEHERREHKAEELNKKTVESKPRLRDDAGAAQPVEHKPAPATVRKIR